jgi:hypothetical protein
MEAGPMRALEMPKLGGSLGPGTAGIKPVALSLLNVAAAC